MMITNKVKNIYSWSALHFFNTFVLFVALNFAIVVASSFSNPFASGDPVSAKYGESKLGAAYPGKSHEVIQDLLRETWSRPYVYEPFTEFKERPYKGNYPYPAKAGCPTVAGRRRTRAAPTGMTPAVSWS